MMFRKVIATAAVAAVLKLSGVVGAQGIQCQPVAVTFTPPHVRGDRDFSGNGPIVDFRVQIYPNPRDGRQILARIYMQARETRSDWTTAQGRQEFVIATLPRHVVRVTSPAIGSYRYVDHDHDEDVFSQPCAPVRQLRFVGDTRGNESGTRTRVTVYFNPIRAQ